MFDKQNLKKKDGIFFNNISIFHPTEFFPYHNIIGEHKAAFFRFKALKFDIFVSFT